MNIKKGDTVLVMSGADKGKTGKVVKAMPDSSRIVVEGVNMRKKHQKPRRTDQKGQVVERPLSLHVSNVSLVDPSSGKPTRVGKKLVGDRYVRIAKKSGATLS